ncbi:MAG: AI-2E family transporter [Bacillota bacterium]
MEKILSFFENQLVRRLGMLLLLGILLFLLKDLINIILLTFILAFIMNKLECFISRKLPKKLGVHPNLIISIQFTVLAGVIILGIVFTVPKLIAEAQHLIANVMTTLGISAGANTSAAGQTLTLKDVLTKLKVPDGLVSMLSTFNLSSLNIGSHLSNLSSTLLGAVKGIYGAAIDFFLAFVLSLFFLVQKKRLYKFGELFEKSKISGFYLDTKEFFQKFINTFGVILQNQVIVSTINTALSLICLYILGYQNLVALGVMIFILGLIPIAGVIISMIPLTLITLSMMPQEGILYTLFGVQLDSVSRLLLLLALGAVIHTMEAYVISPKLLSDKMKLPIFIVICVLIICEHYFKIWGLIVGIPIFVFIIDLLGVDPKATLKT